MSNTRKVIAVFGATVPRAVFAGWFPGAAGIAAMLACLEAHTYRVTDSRDAIVLANKVAGEQPTNFAAWAKANFASPAASRERTLPIRMAH